MKNRYKGVDLPTSSSLAQDLGVTPNAVCQYNRRKKELMLLGLLIDKKLDAFLEANPNLGIYDFKITNINFEYLILTNRKNNV